MEWSEFLFNSFCVMVLLFEITNLNAALKNIELS